MESFARELDYLHSYLGTTVTLLILASYIQILPNVRSTINGEKANTNQ